MVSPSQMPSDTQNTYYMLYVKCLTWLFHLILQQPNVLGAIISLFSTLRGLSHLPSVNNLREPGIKDGTYIQEVEAIEGKL